MPFKSDIVYTPKMDLELLTMVLGGHLYVPGSETEWDKVAGELTLRWNKLYEEHVNGREFSGKGLRSYVKVYIILTLFDELTFIFILDISCTCLKSLPTNNIICFSNSAAKKSTHEV